MKSIPAVPALPVCTSRRAATARPRGMTLVEMMTTLLIVGIVVGLGVPSFLRALARHAVMAQAEELQDAVRVGRSEAIKRGGPVVLCRTDASNTSQCATAGGSWQTWLLFSDAGRNGVFGGADALVRQHVDASSRLTVVSSSASVRFESTGIAHADGGNAVFVLSPAGAGNGDRAAQRQVCVNPRGDVVVIAGDAACP